MYHYKPYNDFYTEQGGDPLGYYLYLPSFFVYHDLATMHTTMTVKFSQCLPYLKADSAYQNKYFIGTAVLQAPFFLIAHALAGHYHQLRTGFSMIYMYAVEASALFYSLMALFFIMIVLRRYFSDAVVAMVILILALATNLYFLVVAQPPFSHIYLLFEYSILLWVTIRFYENLRSGYILLIGLVCGMVILTRFNEVYVVPIPLLWGLHSGADLRDRIRLLKKFIFPVFGAGIIIILCILPQLIYWKISSGKYLYYSYQGESFDFLHPHIWDGLTDGSNGWLVYSPIMILSLTGIYACLRHRHTASVAILFFISLHMYVIYSWWCWFYMGSYGSRPMVEAYAMLSIPLAYSVQWFWRWRWGKTALTFATMFFSFVVMNQTYLTSMNLFNSEMSNWRYNLITLGKTKVTYAESVVRDCKEFQPDHPVLVRQLYENSFEDSTLEGTDTTVASQGRRSQRLTGGRFSQGYNIAAGDIGIKPGQWIKASVDCLTKEHTNHIWHNSNLIINISRNGQSIKWTNVGLQSRIDHPNNTIWHFTANKWGRIYFYSQIPNDIKPTDRIFVMVCHNKASPDIYIDDLRVELYDGK
jgi:hypothetical protein